MHLDFKAKHTIIARLDTSFFYMQLDIFYYSSTQHFQNLIVHLYGAFYSFLYFNNFIIFCFGSPFIIGTTITKKFAGHIHCARAADKSFQLLLIPHISLYITEDK